MPDIPAHDPEGYRTPYAITPVERKGGKLEGSSDCPIYVSDYEDSSVVAIRGEHKPNIDLINDVLPPQTRGRPQQPRKKKEAKPRDPPQQKQGISTEDEQVKADNKRKKRSSGMKKRINDLSSRSKSRERSDKSKKSTKETSEEKLKPQIDVDALDEEEDALLEQELEEITLKSRSGLISGTPAKVVYDIENGNGWRRKSSNTKSNSDKSSTTKQGRSSKFLLSDPDDDNAKSWFAGTLTMEKDIKQRMSRQRMIYSITVLIVAIISIVIVSVGIARGNRPKLGKPLTKEQQEVHNILLGITGEKTLNTPGTPQSLAQEWLFYKDNEIWHLASKEAVIQRFALASLYFATGGRGSKNTWEENNWLVGPECGDENNDAWVGVNCNSDGETRALVLGKHFSNKRGNESTR